MTVADLDIRRAAHLWIKRHGDDSAARAREMFEKMQRRGDKEGVDVWLRIIEAIVLLGEPPTAARH
jgi:hypothetical protein